MEEGNGATTAFLEHLCTLDPFAGEDHRNTAGGGFGRGRGYSSSPLAPPTLYPHTIGIMIIGLEEIFGKMDIGTRFWLETWSSEHRKYPISKTEIVESSFLKIWKFGNLRF